MSDDPEQTPKASIPTPTAPSPQMFARPPATDNESHGASAGTADQGTSDQGTSDAPSGDVATSSRFASTGDPRVDRALAQLPDPEEHRREAEQPPARSARPGDPDVDHDAVGSTQNDTQNDTATGIDLPDPGLLDAHLADVTSVHRQLQQRLSDLSS